MENDIQKLREEKLHSFDSLCRIMELLRSEEGCPWDREQTHESIRPNFIEETYEVIEAIDNRDNALLREELGDVLLQVVFHARIAEEEGAFSVREVIHDVSDKLIRRHPHIFAEGDAKTSEQVLEKWEAIKTEEKQRIGLQGALEAIPPAMPALMRAQKIVKKASRAGFAPDLAVAQNNCGMSTAENPDIAVLERAVERSLFSAAILAQENGLDAETLLSRACQRVSAKLVELDTALTEENSTSQSAENMANDVFFSD